MRIDYLLLAVLSAPAAASATTTWYVDAKANGVQSGASWQDAFVDLQDALAVATSGDAVWVAAGVYKPDGGTLDKTLSFRVPSGVALHGGFAGNEVVLSQRDIVANPTILSGDLLGDDQPPFGNQADNSHQVARLIAGEHVTTVTGLTITGGKYKLFATEAAGLNVESGVSAFIDRCTLWGNTGLAGAGAVGISLPPDGEATVVVSNSDFINNRTVGAEGGAVWIYGNSTARFVNCRFLGNKAFGNAGALACGSGTDVQVVNCAFSGNTGVGCGSAIGSWGKLTVADSTFSRNVQTADNGIGGAICGAAGTITIANCILTENSSAGDTPAHIAAWPGVIVNASYCCMFQQEDPIVGDHQIFLDPLLNNPLGPDGVGGTADDDLSLSSMSPCIDAGDTTQLGADLADFDADGDSREPVMIDLAGRPRLIDRPSVANSGVGVVPVDIGAYEVSNWNDLGHGLEGTHGVPWLAGHGDWFPGLEVSLEVSNAKESALAALVLGSAVQLTPFKAGVLVPQAELALLVRTGPAGTIALSGRAPMILVPAAIAMQFWIIDPAGPANAAATAAFLATLN